MSDATVILKKCPMHMPQGWEPPVPAFSADIAAGSRAVALYIGIQRPTSQSLEALNAIVKSVDLPNYDFASFTDRAGHKNYVCVTYFSSSADHVQWEDSSGFSAWWDDDVHLTADYGLWVERYAFEPGQFETLISSPEGFEGVARQYDKSVGPIREHAYWGGMEDRIPNSAPGILDPALTDMPAVKTEDTLGKRLTVKGPKNLCVIRSGQDLTSVKSDELAEYNAEIEPHLSAGLEFLGKHSETGCFESRYMTHCDSQGQAIAKTFGMQVFLSVSHLQRWAQFHPTHLAIFNSFQTMAMQREGQFDLRLWHEVAVMDENDSFAQYINCDPMTGLLPFRHAL